MDVVNPFGILASHLQALPQAAKLRFIQDLLEVIGNLHIMFLNKQADEYASLGGLPRVISVNSTMTRKVDDLGTTVYTVNAGSLTLKYTPYGAIEFSAPRITGIYQNETIRYSVGPLIDGNGTAIMAHVSHSGDRGHVRFRVYETIDRYCEMPSLPY
jgi:hypothetical protein